MMAGAKKNLILLVLTLLCEPVFSQSDNLASDLYNQGLALHEKRGDKAYPIFVRAMQVAEQNGDWDIYIEAVNRASTLALDGKGSSDKPFKASKEALGFVERFRSRAAVAELHYNIGEFYNLNYDIDTALLHYNKARQIFLLLNGEWTKEVAKCYHGAGDVNKYNKLAFYDAEVNYEKALSIRERIGFQDTLVLYKNFYSLAATNRSQMDFEKGLSYGTKALELARALDPIRFETTTAMIANIYRDMRETEMAQKYYLEAIRLNKKTNIRENRAWYYLSLGEMYKNGGSYTDALKSFSEAYPFYKASKGKDRNLFIYLLLHRAEVYAMTSEEAKFFATIDELFNELSQRNEHRGVFVHDGMVLLGDFYNATNNYDSALLYYQKALNSLIPSFASLKIEDNPTEEDIGFFYSSHLVLVKKASALTGKFSATKDPDFLKQSLDCLRLAEQLLSKHRGLLDMDKSKWVFLDAEYDIYEDIVERLFESQAILPEDTVYSLVFRYFESSKSRSLSDALAQAEQTKKITAKDSLFNIHTELRQALLAVQDNINYELEKSPSSSEISALRAEMVNIDRRIQNCKRAIEEKYPGYFNVKYGDTTPALQEVRRILKDRDQVALEYFWGSKSVYALAISTDKMWVQKIGSPDSLAVAITGLVRHFDENTSGIIMDNYQKFVLNAHLLYRKLVSPFASILNGHERLLIIPDGPINQVPFEILLGTPAIAKTIDYRSLNYLIKEFSIGYAYSSAMVMRENENPVRTPSLLAVGYTGDSRLRAPQPELEEIFGAEEELEALAERFEGGKFLVGADATEANFKSLSSEYDIIHLAIHGRGDIQRDFSSTLYFRAKYDSLDDGELHDYELYGLKLKALMAVLSACETGLGRGYKGEGMISMASAFTYSGCRNILMSLWKVNDNASNILMDDFYDQLLKGRTIDDALRQAKLDYLKSTDELTADPKIWAPLVAYGSLERIFPKSNNGIFYAAVGLLLLIAVLFVVRRRRVT